MASLAAQDDCCTAIRRRRERRKAGTLRRKIIFELSLSENRNICHTAPVARIAAPEADHD
jgi:hypothetical protein